MQLHMITIISYALFSFLVGSIVVGLIVRRRRQSVLKQQCQWLTPQTFPLARFSAYHNYANMRSLISATTYWSVCPVLWFILVAISNLIPGQSFLKDLSGYAFYAFFVGVWLQGVINDITIDTEVLRILQINRLSEHKFASITIYSKLFAINPLLMVVTLTPIPILAIAVTPLLMGFSFGFISATAYIDLILLLDVLLLLSFDLFPYQYARRTTALQPIEETQWASLLPRISAWANLAGITFSSIQIAQDPIGKHSVRVVGRGQHPILVIGEALLHASEWRVQDALICMALGSHKMRIASKLFARHLWYLGLVCAWIPTTILVGLLPYTPLRIGIGILMIVLPIVAVVITLLYPRKAYYQADRFAVRLTGDPLALIAAYHLTAALNGVQPRWSKRIQQLVKFGKQSWPRSPYADRPVPCVLNINTNNLQVTVPPSFATPPVPLPDTLLYGTIN